MCTIAIIIWALFHPAGERVFAIPTTAMAPTLIIGDRAVMIPYPPGAGPERGDIIAFRDPRDPFTVQMFRVIGHPGDSIRLEDGVVLLNGVPAPREAIGEYVIDFGFELQPAELWRETLPDGSAYDTLDADPDGFLDNTADHDVPPGHYFVLGDNRDNAADSRVPYMGVVPEGNVLGRIDRILASCNPDGRFLADRTGLPVGP